MDVGQPQPPQLAPVTAARSLPVAAFERVALGHVYREFSVLEVWTYQDTFVI